MSKQINLEYQLQTPHGICHIEPMNFFKNRCQIDNKYSQSHIRISDGGIAVASMSTLGDVGTPTFREFTPEEVVKHVIYQGLWPGRNSGFDVGYENQRVVGVFEQVRGGKQVYSPIIFAPFSMMDGKLWQTTLEANMPVLINPREDVLEEKYHGIATPIDALPQHYVVPLINITAYGEIMTQDVSIDTVMTMVEENWHFQKKGVLKTSEKRIA
jgi:hypothetical protein